MLRRLLSLLLLLALACAAHEKAGDRARAVGDWKTAEREYGEALQSDPDQPEIRGKYQEARVAALAQSQRQAQACAAAKDWECALAEAEYALRLDPGSTPMALLRRDAGREAGYLRLRRAGEALQRGQAAAALGLLQQARAATDDAGVAAEASRAQPGIVRAVTDEAERLRAAHQYPQAIELYSQGARVEPRLAPRLGALRAEYERFKDQEAERLALEGDALLSQRRFADAQSRYEAAAQIRPPGRAAPLARYARWLAEGDAAAARRDFGAAERAYAEAARSGLDRGLAVEALDRVKLRLYTIRLRSVLVRPVRPDGYPWSGPRSWEMDRVAARFAEISGAGSVPAGLLADLSRRIPSPNQPNLVVTVALPDGRSAQTPPRRGAYLGLEGGFVVAANAFDDRSVSLRVVHDDGGPRPMDVGLVSFRIADLVARRELPLGDASVAELRVECAPADLPEGAVTGLTPIPGGANEARVYSLPTARSLGFRLASVELTVAAADRPAPADLRVEVEQRGQVVYRSPRASGLTPSWRPPAAYLFVEPEELVVLRLVAEGRGPAAVIVARSVAGRDLARGAFDLTSPRGSLLRLRLDAGRGGPPPR